MMWRGTLGCPIETVFVAALRDRGSRAGGDVAVPSSRRNTAFEPDAMSESILEQVSKCPRAAQGRRGTGARNRRPPAIS